MNSTLSTTLTVALLVICIAFAIVMVVVVSSRRDLTGLEAVLLQVVILASGLVGSYLVGQKSASAEAREFVKAHARSAFRRVVSLYASLSHLALRIDELQREQTVNRSDTLITIEAIVREQIRTGADALEDWRDIVPEDVQDIQNRLAEEASVEDLRQ